MKKPAETSDAGGNGLPQNSALPPVSYLILKANGEGTTRQAISTCRGLIEANVCTRLVTVSSGGAFVDETHDLPVTCLSRDGSRSTNGAIAMLLRLPKLIAYLKAQPEDHVLVAGSKTVASIALAAHRLSGRRGRLVLTITNDLFHRVTREDSGRKLSVAVLACTYPAADRIISLTDAMKAELIDNHGLPADKMVTIPPPINIDLIERKSTEPAEMDWLKEGRPNTIPVLLHVGRLCLQKDQITLLRAFAELLKSGPHRLIIIGTGKPEYRASLESEIHRLGITDHVLLGGLDANPYRLMARADAFVLSSLWEGFGIVIPEALALGCPVVSVDCPYGPDDILDGGRYGALTAFADVPALAAGMADILATPPSGEIMRERAELYGSKQVVARFIDMLRALDTR